MQTRQRTLWTFSSRTLDSREVLDSTNNGLKRGRIDVPASLMVKVEGYDKIEYVTTFSNGTSSTTDTFAKAIASNGKPVVETITGSGIMTFFIDETGSATSGINKVDVVKTWEETDPEPELSPVDWPRQTLYAGTMGLGLDFVFKNGEMVSSAARGGNVISRMGQWASSAAEQKSFAQLVAKAIKNASPADLKTIKDALGIVETPPAAE